MYVNGSEITAFSTSNNPTQNSTIGVNNNSTTGRIGQDAPASSSRLFDGYMTDINFIDGQALTPNSFGTFNSFGVWQPITYGGSYGTNGFYLPFNPGTSTFVGSFNGSNQSLSLAQNAAFNFGTGDFTIEACVYGNSWNSVNPIIALGDGAVGGGSPIYSGWVMRYDSANGLGLYRFDGSETSLFSGATVPVNTWNHMAISRSSGTLRMFINGVQVYSAANTTSYNNVNSNTLKIGGNWTIGGGVVTWVNGYISNVRIVNNAGLYTTNFTPPTANLTAVSGTALLTLQNSSIVDNSTNAFTITNNNTVTTGQTYPFSAAKIFNDQSPQGNNWTPNNIGGGFGSTLDYMTDVPTLTSTTAANYAVLNPLWKGANITPTDGNLTNPLNNGSPNAALSTMPMSTGKWYAEMTNTASYGDVGLCIVAANLTAPTFVIGSTTQTGLWEVYDNGGGIYVTSDGGAFSSSLGATRFRPAGTIQFAYDASNGYFWIGRNNTWYDSSFGTTGDPSTGANPTFTISSSRGPFNIGAGSNSATNAQYWNFGQQPWAYTPPTGFLALNTFNL
jgi:hypothetical protein